MLNDRCVPGRKNQTWRSRHSPRYRSQRVETASYIYCKCDPDNQVDLKGTWVKVSEEKATQCVTSYHDTSNAKQMHWTHATKYQHCEGWGSHQNMIWMRLPTDIPLVRIRASSAAGCQLVQNRLKLTEIVILSTAEACLTNKPTMSGPGLNYQNRSTSIWQV